MIHVCEDTDVANVLRVGLEGNEPRRRYCGHFGGRRRRGFGIWQGRVYGRFTASLRPPKCKTPEEIVGGGSERMAVTAVVEEDVTEKLSRWG